MKLELLNAYPEIILVNGKIYTMDAQFRQAQALAVKNRRIIALGTNDQVRQLAGPRTEILDAKGRTVLPGLIDSHTHPPLWAVEHWLGANGDFAAKRYNDPQMQIFYAKGNDQVMLLRELERIVRQRQQTLGPAKWIWVNLFGGKSLVESRKIVYPLMPRPGASGSTGAMITRQFLDMLAPNNPLILMTGEVTGPSVSNTRAKTEMEKYLVSGDMLQIQARAAIVFDIFFRNRTADAADFLKRELLECLAAQGITSFANDYSGSYSTLKVHKYLEAHDDLPVRWAWWFGGAPALPGSNQDPDPFSYYYTLGDFQSVGSDYIWNVGVANQTWEWGPQGKGGIGTCTEATPLSTANQAELYMPCEKMLPNVEQYGGYKNIQAALRLGLRVGYLHHYSDGTLDALVKMLDDEIATGRLTLEQTRALRIGTEHNPMIRPDQIAKIAKYDIRPGLNGYQIQGDIKGGAFLKNYGESYMSWMVPMKSLVDAGVHPVLNTDIHLHKVPPESKDNDYPSEWDGNFWAFFEFFVTRRLTSNGPVFNSREAVDRTNLMKTATIWGAEQLLNEKNIGSLEVGKLADFIVIDKDYFTIPENQIHTIRTMLTAVGGKVVFKGKED